MKIFVLANYNLIVGVSAKCGTTTIKKYILDKLNIKIPWTNVDNFHKEFNTQILNNHEYRVYDLNKYRKLRKKKKVEDYRRILILRNPFKRLISGIKEKSEKIAINFGYQDETINGFINKIKETNFFATNGFLRHHFRPQTDFENGQNITFQECYDIKDITKIKELLNIQNDSKRMNSTNYEQNETYINDIRIKDLIKLQNTSSNVKNWFNTDNIDLIYDLYKEDFKRAKEFNIIYDEF
jgi:hypothetical protein